MAVNLTSPVTGGAQTGFTSPTYTVVAAQAPDVNAKRWYVSALGGTQAGVDIHSVAKQFTVTVFQPKNPRGLSAVNPVTGQLREVPMNKYHLYIHKGVVPLSGQPAKDELLHAEFSIPAGSDSADAPNVRAGLSLFVGVINQISSGLGDTLIQGTL